MLDIPSSNEDDIPDPVAHIDYETDQEEIPELVGYHDVDDFEEDDEDELVGSLEDDQEEEEDDVEFPSITGQALGK